MKLQHLGSAVLVGIILLAVSVVYADDRPLSGAVGAITIDDNVIIPSGTTAVLNGTSIRGNVRVMDNAQLTMVGARVDGDVQAYSARSVDLRQGTQVQGNVQGENTISVLVRENTSVGGNVQIKEARAAASQNGLLVSGSQVKGDVQAEKSSGKLTTTGNAIGGNLQFVENKTGSYTISNNTINGDLQFFKNRGSGTITGNHIKGNLQSKENSTAPAVQNNQVQGDTETEG